MSTARNHPANCCCEQSQAETHALGGSAWSDSRWSAMDPANDAGDHGGFDIPTLIKIGTAVVVIVIAVRWWL